MENFKNAISTIFMTFSTTVSLIDGLEQWTRIVAGMVTIMTALITWYRWYKQDKKND